jgi:DNA-binding response OmpR family regulator
MDDYVSKPIDAKELFAAIERAFPAASQIPLAKIRATTKANRAASS